jgi:hypothetical protein
MLPPERSPSIHRTTRKEIAARAALELEKTSQPSELTLALAPISFDLKTAAMATGMKTNILRDSIASRALPAKLAGKKYFVFRSDLWRFMQALPDVRSRSDE